MNSSQRQPQQAPRPLLQVCAGGRSSGACPAVGTLPQACHPATKAAVHHAAPYNASRTVRQQQFLAGVDGAGRFDDHVPLARAVAVGDRRLQVPPAAAAARSARRHHPAGMHPVQPVASQPADQSRKHQAGRSPSVRPRAPPRRVRRAMFGTHAPNVVKGLHRGLR